MSDILSPEFTDTGAFLTPKEFLEVAEAAGLLDPFLDDPNHNQRTILAAILAVLNDKRRTSSFGHRQMWVKLPGGAEDIIRLVPTEYHAAITALNKNLVSLTKLQEEATLALAKLYMTLQIAAPAPEPGPPQTGSIKGSAFR